MFKEKKTEVQKNEESQKTKGNQNKSKKPTRQLFTLNKRIINKYIYLLNNIYEDDELFEIFPSIKIQEDSPITNIDRSCMINIIQTTLEQHNFIDLIDYLIYALAIIYAISVPLHSYANMLSYLEKLIASFLI